MKLRCALIGCGTIAPTHLNAIDNYPNADVVAVCDIRSERMQALVINHPDIKQVADYNDLLDKSIIDVIVVLTEHDQHLPVVQGALNAGIHVLCEKPVAVNLLQLDSLMQALKIKKSIAGGVFQHRFEPYNIVLKECYNSGLLGTGLTITLEHRCLRAADYYNQDKWRGTLKHEGGSVLINQSIHFFDLLLFIAGDIQSLSCSLANRTHGDLIETEDSAVGTLKFKSGLLGSFAVTSSSQCESWSYRITLAGSKATVIIADGKPMVVADDTLKQIIEDKFKRHLNLDNDSAEKHYYGGGHSDNICDFLDAVINNSNPKVTLESASISTALIHYLYKSAQLKQTINFNPPYLEI